MADQKVEQFSLAEPLGVLTVEQKNAITEKVIFRKFNGTWLPEFKGDTISQRDVNIILRALNAGYRRYARLLYMNRRIQEAKKASDDAKIQQPA